MRFAKPIFFVLVAALAVPLGCDWVPGSKLNFGQVVRTWTDVDSGECLTLGTYRFALDSEFPPFEAKASLRLKTDLKEDMEFLPPYFDLNYRYDGGIFYQQSFELKNGKGKFREHQPDWWSFDDGDEIEYEICAGGGGTIPTFTTITAKFDYKFDKFEIK